MSAKTRDYLSKPHRTFVEQYIKHGNAALAARTAGMRAPDAGKRLMHRADIQRALAEIAGKSMKKIQLTADQVIEELARIGFSDMRAFAAWGPDGVKLKPSDGLEPDQAMCVAEVSQTTSEGGGSLKFKLHDKVEALGKLLGHFQRIEEQANPTTRHVAVIVLDPRNAPASMRLPDGTLPPPSPLLLGPGLIPSTNGNGKHHE